MPTKKDFTLFFIPFAGGSSYAYRDFEKYLNRKINMAAIDLPGHGKRIKELPLNDLNEMVDDVFFQMKNYLNSPYAIFGHSMGATLAYLVAAKITKSGLSQPDHLFLTGRASPTVPIKDRNTHLLPKKEFFNHLKSYDGIPDILMQERDMLEFFEPVLRADIGAINTYDYKSNGRIDIPISAMIGQEDIANYNEAMRWQEVTTAQTLVHQFPGKHFFIFDFVLEITKIIAEALGVNEKGSRFTF